MQIANSLERFSAHSKDQGVEPGWFAFQWTFSILIFYHLTSNLDLWPNKQNIRRWIWIYNLVNKNSFWIVKRQRFSIKIFSEQIIDNPCDWTLGLELRSNKYQSSSDYHRRWTMDWADQPLLFKIWATTSAAALRIVKVNSEPDNFITAIIYSTWKQTRRSMVDSFMCENGIIMFKSVSLPWLDGDILMFNV